MIILCGVEFLFFSYLLVIVESKLQDIKDICISLGKSESYEFIPFLVKKVLPTYFGIVFAMPLYFLTNNDAFEDFEFIKSSFFVASLNFISFLFMALSVFSCI
jgi:hypothetical protein